MILSRFPENGGDKEKDWAEDCDHGEEHGRYDEYDCRKNSEKEFRYDHPQQRVDVERDDESR